MVAGVVFERTPSGRRSARDQPRGGRRPGGLVSVRTGEALQDLRYEMGKTTAEMADLLAVSAYTLRDYEKGRIPIRVAVGMLAAALAEGWLTEEQLSS